MGLLLWWRKRKGAVEGSIEPVISYKTHEDQTILIVTSSLSYETICDEIAKSYPPPYGFLWRLTKFETYPAKKNFHHYHYRLEEKKNENKESKRITKM